MKTLFIQEFVSVRANPFSSCRQEIRCRRRKQEPKLRVEVASVRVRRTVLVVMLAALALLAAGCFGVIWESIAREQVEKVLDLYEQANLAEDANLLGSLVGDRVIVDGVEFTREQYLDRAEAEWAVVDYSSYMLTERRYTFAEYRDAVVNAVRVTRLAGGSTASVAVRFSLQKLADGWKIVRLDHNP
ncbi:MAG: hypothetical protein IMX00_09945 [Limnochordales bacterium]|nr:hypothetical protein [Limnochordales bacterium]